MPNRLPPEVVDPVEHEHRPTWLPAVMAGVVVVVGLAAALASRHLRYWTELGPGPGFFPLWLGILLGVLGTVWLVALLRGRTTAAEETAATDEDTFSAPTVIAIVVSLCVLAALLEVLGYQLSMLMFLLFHLLVLARRGPVLSAILSLAGSFGVFVVFTRVLSVSLPASSIPLLRDMGL